MNFFEQQDQARRRTVWLVLLFILAIVCVALSFYALALIVIVPQAQERGAQGAQIWWNTEIFLQITGAGCFVFGYFIRWGLVPATVCAECEDFSRRGQ